MSIEAIFAFGRGDGIHSLVPERKATALGVSPRRLSSLA